MRNQNSKSFINKPFTPEGMVIVHRGRVGRTSSGGRYTQFREKRIFEQGNLPVNTGIGKEKILAVQTKGGGQKTKVLVANVVNLYDPKTKTYAKAEIKTVTDTPANVHFVRRNIMTKGAVVETTKGKARITSRPGQHGTVNAVLV